MTWHRGRIELWGGRANVLFPSVNGSHPAGVDAEDGDGRDRGGCHSVNVGGTEGDQGGGSDWVYDKAFEYEWALNEEEMEEWFN